MLLNVGTKRAKNRATSAYTLLFDIAVIGLRNVGLSQTSFHFSRKINFGQNVFIKGITFSIFVYICNTFEYKHYNPMAEGNRVNTHMKNAL